MHFQVLNIKIWKRQWSNSKLKISRPIASLLLVQNSSETAPENIAFLSSCSTMRTTMIMVIMAMVDFEDNIPIPKVDGGNTDDKKYVTKRRR